MLIQPIWGCPKNTKLNSTQTISGERMIFPLRLEGWDSATYIHVDGGLNMPTEEMDIRQCSL